MVRRGISGWTGEGEVDEDPNGQNGQLESGETLSSQRMLTHVCL